MVASSSHHREKCRALFKKGQKCLMPKFIQQDSDELLLFIPGEIMRAEKRTVEVESVPVASYHYRVQYVDEGKEYDEWKEETELYKYHVDLMSGEESLLAEQVRQQAWQQHDYKKAQARLEKIPERLRLRIPVALKRCVVEDYQRVCVNGEVDTVRPRVRGGAAQAMEVEDGGGDVHDNEDGKGADQDEKHVRDDGKGSIEAMEVDEKATTSERGLSSLDKEDGGQKNDEGSRHAEDPVSKARREMSVAAIIRSWRTKMLNEDEVIQDDTLEEGINIIAESLITYFNCSVRQFLLYAPEVPLYDELFGKKRKRHQDGEGSDELEPVEPADVYGVEHLVRLLIKIPELVCVQMMVLPVESARYIVAVEDRLMELMDFLVESFYPDVPGDGIGAGENNEDENSDEK